MTESVWISVTCVGGAEAWVQVAHIRSVLETRSGEGARVITGDDQYLDTKDSFQTVIDRITGFEP